MHTPTPNKMDYVWVLNGKCLFPLFLTFESNIWNNFWQIEGNDYCQCKKTESNSHCRDLLLKQGTFQSETWNPLNVQDGQIRQNQNLLGKKSRYLKMSWTWVSPPGLPSQICAAANVQNGPELSEFIVWWLIENDTNHSHGNVRKS